MGELCTVLVGLSSGSGAVSPRGRVWASQGLAEICKGLTLPLSSQVLSSVCPGEEEEEVRKS